MPAIGALEIVKPFAWMASIAFLIGFVGYLVLGQANQAVAQEEPYAVSSTARVSGPSSDEWNIPKHI